MNFQAVALFLVLLIYYAYFTFSLPTVLDVVYFSSAYILCVTILKIFLDKGVFLSLYYIMAVAYFYYVGKEIYFYNPMLTELTDEEVLLAVKLVSISSIIILTALSCSSNKRLLLDIVAKPRQADLYLNKWVTLSIFFFYVGLMAMPAYLTFSLGRAEVYDSSFASIAMLVPFLNAMGYLLPVFLHLSFRGGLFSSVIKFAMIAVVFAIQISIGNRFVILFSFFIYISMLVDMRKIGLKNVVLPIGLLSFVSLIMGQLRSTPDSHSGAAISSEGIIYYLSGLIRFYSENEHSFLPIYSTFSTYFLLPRAIWPNKPELIGSWIPNSGVFMTKFAEGHSGSVSFMGPFFADFGSLFFVPVLILALVMVWMDKYLLKYVGEYSSKGIIAASFVPLVFFGYRSFNTSVAAEIILILIVHLVLQFNQLRITNLNRNE